MFEFYRKAKELDKATKEQWKANDIEAQSASFEIDFAAIEAVGIERVHRPEWVEGPPISKTVIGYMRGKEPGINILNLKCSIYEHEKLAKQFREYMSNKKAVAMLAERERGE